MFPDQTKSDCCFADKANESVGSKFLMTLPPFLWKLYYIVALKASQFCKAILPAFHCCLIRFHFSILKGPLQYLKLFRYIGHTWDCNFIAFVKSVLFDHSLRDAQETLELNFVYWVDFATFLPLITKLKVHCNGYIKSSQKGPTTISWLKELI